MSQQVPKKVRLKLVGLDGNAFFLMGAFARQARREGWTKAEIDAVLNEAKSSDYNTESTFWSRLAGVFETLAHLPTRTRWSRMLHIVH